MAEVAATAAPRLMRAGSANSPSIYTLFRSTPPRRGHFSPYFQLPLKIPQPDLPVDSSPCPIALDPARYRATKSESGLLEGFEEEMTISPSVKISADRRLLVSGSTLLSGVPENVTLTSAQDSSCIDGVFIGANFLRPASRHILPLGTLRDARFVACFRFKLWWMSQRMGDRGRDIPLETQFLLMEIKNRANEVSYSVFLPLIEGSFRSSLQGNVNDELELCIESGDAITAGASFSAAALLTAGESDPFAAISSAVEAARFHLQSFRLRKEKKIPQIVDLFGWCTWDAFYQDVSQEGVEAGLQSLADGGFPPKFVIIDDGWQSVDSGDDGQKTPLMRLTAIEENAKFRIDSIVDIAKKKYGLSHVFVWHAITGYWGGVKPSSVGMEHYLSVMKYPKVSPGVEDNEPGMKTDPLTVHGLGLVDPKKVHQFYDDLHGYLAGAGVDGVKVDVQSILETLGGGFGGRVELARVYHQALDASVKKNFPDNGIIACMSHSSDALYHSKQTAVVRASDDFYPRDPVSHTIHIASVAYNSLFLGEFMLPDWDMFHSLHPAAEYHASARAISGGPVYVSDAPGKHNFDLLKKLVLPDGSVLRARLPGRPTLDCLFTDPARDGISLLKIWNMNKYTGVLGIYNCQGAAWCRSEKKNVFHHTESDSLTCTLKGTDVHHIADAAMDASWNGDCAVYKHGGGATALTVLPKHAAMPVSLKILQHEIFIISPIKAFSPALKFAPLGLVDMFNGGRAVDDLVYGSSTASVFLEVKGCGRFGAYSSSRPRKCTLDSSDVEFSYDSSSGLVLINLEDMPKGTGKVHSLVVYL